MSLISPSREALRLYRDIIRGSRHFRFRHPQGGTWEETLLQSARREYEAARWERDPEIIARLILVGRESLNQVLEKVAVKQNQLIKDPIKKK